MPRAPRTGAPDGDAPAPKKRKRIDWEAVERDYRTGKFTLYELQDLHHVNYADISKRAKRDGWTKDLRGLVKQATTAAVLGELTKVAQEDTKNTVLAAAEIGKQVILAHRTDLRQSRQVATDLLSELQQARLLDEQAELLATILAGEGATPAQDAQARAAVQRAVSLGSRINSIKALAETFTKLQAAERTAFDLDDKGDKDKPDDVTEQIAEFVSAIHSTGAGRLPVAGR